MDSKRYLNLIDFTFAIKYSDKNILNNIITGNRNETAPEILNHSEYDYNSDYYRIGTILYYLIFKEYANVVKKRNNFTDLIIDYNKITNYSSSCIDFLNNLIVTDYKKRIGFKNINELKNHFWFNGFDWEKFEKKKIKSPLKFMKKSIKKTRCKKLKISNIKKAIHKKIEKSILYKKLIQNYDYVNKIIINKILDSFKK